MKKLTIISVFVLLLFGASVQAQQWNEAQTEVWTAVLGSYADIDNSDVNWTDKWVTDDAVVWGSGFPMPRTRDSIKRWNGYQFPQSDTLMSEYSPAAIVVHGNTAVAHYYYSNGAKNKEGKHKTTHGRCSDILVKDDEMWKFLSWHCADTPSND